MCTLAAAGRVVFGFALSSLQMAWPSENKLALCSLNKQRQYEGIAWIRIQFCVCAVCCANYFLRQCIEKSTTATSDKQTKTATKNKKQSRAKLWQNKAFWMLFWLVLCGWSSSHTAAAAWRRPCVYVEHCSMQLSQHQPPVACSLSCYIFILLFLYHSRLRLCVCLRVFVCLLCRHICLT